ncbi:MAG TPA: DUF411 domain-containing protein [Gemmatimonadales bacterium]|jgi:hypothetical protein
MITRRRFIAQTTGVTLAALSGERLWAQLARFHPITLTVFKSPTCGCCSKWVDHVKAFGFAVRVHDEEDMDPIKDRLGVPAALRSCHTAQADGYLIEGHVPANDIQRLLATRPKMAGLAVPGMPRSTPGMATPGEPAEPYTVVAFRKDGSTQVFARH